ncbi:hypothetical protein ABZ023_18060 [Streptomyces sp. NPDC006367]|uniref:hypothetical protein n=1 Tax=unclassified Streptomyces TaxID=2593676 RepID=UPI0033B468CB
MANFLDDQTDAKRLAQVLAEYELRLQALERTTQASFTSIEGGSLDIYDDEGVLKGSVGVQPDGGVALIPVNTTPPPTPTPPVVGSELAGLLVVWDGQWDDSYQTPTDFSLVQVHVGPSPDFTPSLATQVATITAQLGGSVTVHIDHYNPVWVRLVAQNTGLATGPASVAVQGQARQAVSQDLIDDIVTAAKIAEGAVTINALTEGLADTASQRWVDSMGDPSTWAVNASGPGASWTVPRAAADAPTGGTVGEAVGYIRMVGTTPIPYDPDVLYRVSARIRATVQPAVPDAVYVGVLGLAADKATPVNRFGANSPNSHTYAAASSRAIGTADGWVVVTGYLKGRAATGGAGPYTDPRAPAPLHTDTRYIAPYVWLNYNQSGTPAAGVMQVDAVTVEALKTGIVDSTNLVAGSVTTAALAADSVTATKILAGAVTAAKIDAGAVTTAKLDALAVTADKLAANSVTATKILAGAIDATHIKAGSISADRLALGTDGNVAADPSFEGEISDQRIAGVPYLSFAAGNGTPRAVQVDCVSATAVSRALRVAQIGVLPGTKFFLGVDYLASADWAGRQLSAYARWENAAGGTLGYGNVNLEDMSVVRGAWSRLQGITSTAAPEGAVRAVIQLACDDVTAGTVAFDNVIARVVVASGPAGARAELSPLGMQLFDASGEEAIALMTGRPNYLTLYTAGLPVATIDQGGNGQFQSLAVADTLTVGGTPLGGLLDQVPRGVQAICYQYSSRTAASTEMGFVELAADIDESRMYRIRFAARADPSEAGGELRIRLRDGGPNVPTIASPQRYIAVHPMPVATSFTAGMEFTCSGKWFGAGLHRFLITFHGALGPSTQTTQMYGASDNPGYFYIEDIGPFISETGSYNDGGGTVAPSPKKYTKTYPCAWSGSYSQRGSYNAHYGNSCYQGYYSSTNGVQASLIGFPSSLATDLAGATILEAKVYLYFDHWYANAGGRAVIKAHSHGSRPASFSADGESQTVSWARNEGKWVDITNVFDSTRWRGVALDPNSSSSTYYGRARGYGQTNPPQLRVTYTK